MCMGRRLSVPDAQCQEDRCCRCHLDPDSSISTSISFYRLTIFIEKFMSQDTTFQKYHISKTIILASFLLLQKEAGLIMGHIIIVVVLRQSKASQPPCW